MFGVRSASVLSAACALLVSAAAHATIMLPLTVEEMAQEASAVVRARVVDRSAEWDRERKRIYTTTTLEISDAIKGDVSRRIQVRTLGGEADGVGMKVAGTPQFAMGEEVLVFLRPDPGAPAVHQVIGMAQGKYQLRQDEHGRVVAAPSLDGIAFATPGVDGVLRAGGHAPAVPEQSYVELRQRIVAAAAASAPAQSLPPAQAPAVPKAPDRPAAIE